jgi:hypothetical protein
MVHTRWSLAVGLGMLVATQARGQNLLVNPNFDTGTTGWNTFQGMIFDPTRDSTSSATSGSGQQASTGPFCNHTSQCVDIVPGATYSLTGSLLFPAGVGVNDGPGTAAIFMGFYDAACSSNSFNLVGAPPITDVPNSGTKEAWNPESQTGTAPFTALSAFIDLEVCQQVDQTNVTANFDTLDFHLSAPAPSAAVPALGKAGAILLAGLLAAIGLVAIRRLF